MLQEPGAGPGAEPRKGWLGFHRCPKCSSSLGARGTCFLPWEESLLCVPRDSRAEQLEHSAEVGLPPAFRQKLRAQPGSQGRVLPASSREGDPVVVVGGTAGGCSRVM